MRLFDAEQRAAIADLLSRPDPPDLLKRGSVRRFEADRKKARRTLRYCWLVFRTERTGLLKKETEA